MMTEPEEKSPTSITTQPFFDDVDINTTSLWHDVNNVTEAFQAPEGCLVIPFSTFTPLDHPDDLVSRETQQHFRQFVDVYFLSLCFLISVPTNAISMAVFWKHGIKERINLCLFCLSFADLTVLVFNWTMRADKVYAVASKTVHRGDILKFFVNNKILIVSGFTSVSGFLSTLVAFERCLCVVSPLKAQSMVQTKTTAAIIAIGHVIILGGGYVVISKFIIVCIFDPFTGDMMNLLYSSDFYIHNKEFIDIFSGIIYGIVLTTIYTVGVSVATVVTVVKLRRMAEWRKQSSSSASLPRGSTTVKDMTLTRMLIGTSCVFVVCLISRCLLLVIPPFVPQLTMTGKYQNAYYVLIATEQMFSYTNSSVNFFVYYLFGTRYRQTVRGMFCGWRRTKKRDKMTTAIDQVTTDTADYSVSQ